MEGVVKRLEELVSKQVGKPPVGVYAKRFISELKRLEDGFFYDNRVSTLFTDMKNDPLAELLLTPVIDNVPTNISGAHIHMSKEMEEKLYGSKKPVVLRELIQPGQYLTDKRVTLKGPYGMVEHLAVLGPARENAQAELLKKHILNLGYRLDNVPIRDSGDIRGTPQIQVFNPETNQSYVTENGLIRAMPHVHLSEKSSLESGLLDGNHALAQVRSISGKYLLCPVTVRVSKNCSDEVHFDKDDAKGYNLPRDAPTRLYKCQLQF